MKTLTHARLALVLAAFAAAGTLRAERLTVVCDGRSDHVIAVPDDPAEARKVLEAAEAFRDLVAESTGVTLPTVREAEVGDRPAVYLGRTRRGAGAGVPFGMLRDYTTFRLVVGRDVFLAGCDESAGIRGGLRPQDRAYLCINYGLNASVKDQSYRRWFGTLKAVLGVLEKAGAVEYLLPGENGRNVKACRTLTLDGLDGLVAPTFPYSNCRCYGDLRTTTAFGHMEIPYNRTWGGHPLPVAVPRSRYEKTHPEYFILKDGVRRPDFGPAGGGHHCVSNPEVKRLLLAYLKEQYDLGYRWVQVGPTDGQVACECEACRTLHADPHERQWLFFRAIAEDSRTLMPEAKMVLLSYDFTANAPKSFDRFPDNVVVELCIWDRFREKFEDWARFRDVPKIAYVYFFGAYHAWAFAPTRSPKYLAEQMRILRDNNVRCIFKCGWGEDLGLCGPLYYVFSRLLEDVDRDPEALVDAFCEKAYGAAAAPMRKFYRLLYADLDTTGGHSVIDETKKLPHNHDQMFEFAFRPYGLQTMGRMLGAAEAMHADDPKVTARLRLVRRSYDFLNLRAKCYFLQDAFAVTQGPELLDAALRVYEERERLLDGWYDGEGRMKPLPGFGWPYLNNVSRTVLVNGGGMQVPCFPALFRYGPKNVLQLKVESDSRPKKPVCGEYWDVFELYARKSFDGEPFSADVSKDCDAGSDAVGIVRRAAAFRERHAEFLVRGRLIGRVEFLEPDPVFGVFRRDDAGKVAAFVANCSPAVQKVRFRFPGADGISCATLDPCTMKRIDPTDP